MLSNQKIAKDQVSTFDNELSLVETDLGDSRIGISIILTLAGVFGVWGSISLMNGILQANSIKQIGQGLFTAITGL